MKNLFKWAFILSMILALVAIGAVACDDDEETTEPTADETAATTGEPTAPVTVEPEKSTYKIGAVLSITGPASHLGVPEENTAKMMEDQINAAGGINGHPIEVIIYDTETNAEKCATMVDRLIDQDNVLAIVGPTTSGNSLAIIDRINQAEVPLVSCAANAGIVNPVTPWVFKTPQTDKEAVAEIYAYLQQKGIANIAIITDTSGFGAGGKDFLQDDVAGYGLTVVEAQEFTSGDTSMQSQLTVIKGTDAEAVVCWATDKESAMVALDMETLNMEIPLYCSHGIANPAFIEQAGSAADGVIFPAGKLLFVDKVPDDDPQKEVLVQYIADYEALGKGSFSTFGGHLYDALSMVVIALDGIDEGLDTAAARAQVRDEIEQVTEFAGTGGLFTMSADNHLGMATGSLGMVEIVDGEWTLAQ